jgi:ribonuclease HII
VVKGDGISLSIAAASIIAKVSRDRRMQELAEEFPVYGFERHKGYGTKAHLEALRRHGPCREHRRSFAPVAALLE